MNEILELLKLYPDLEDLSPYDYLLLTNICNEMIKYPIDSKLEREFPKIKYKLNSTLNFIREYIQTFKNDDTYQYIITETDIIGKYKPPYPSRYAKVQSYSDLLTSSESESLKNDGIKYIRLNTSSQYKNIFDVTESPIDAIPARMILLGLVFLALVIFSKLL